jgi:hypothetical protein
MTFDFQNQVDVARPPHPLVTLPREDLDLIAELVLKSGSLKDLAAVYGVSYPTIRLRVDKVIARLQDALAGRQPDPVNDLLARLVEQGEMTPSGARAVRDLRRQLAQRADGPAPGPTT